MSLKAFHIFFIGMSTLLTFGLAAYLFTIFGANGDAGTLIGAVATMIIGASLIGYGIRFLKKLKHVSYL